jgi:hypothetical protein
LELVAGRVGIGADPRAQSHEFVAQVRDRQTSELGFCWQAGVGHGSDSCGGAGAVEAVEGQVLVVAAAHDRGEALEQGSLIGQLARLTWGELGALQRALGGGVDEEQLGCLARSR